MPPPNPPQSTSPPKALELALRPAVQSLYAFETQIIYPPSSSPQILQTTLNDILTQLRTISATASQPAQMDFVIPPDVIEYVQDGRNPDIYVREFVELTMRNNQRLRGKFGAFATFRDVLAREIVGGVPEMAKDVAMVVPDVVVKKEDGENP